MAVIQNNPSLLMLNRFGLGQASTLPISQDFSKNPASFFLSESPIMPPQELQSVSDIGRQLITMNKAIVDLRNAKKQEAPMEATPMMQSPQQMTTPVNASSDFVSKVFQKELAQKMDFALKLTYGFTERWVMFWSNHFCISADKNQVVRGLAGAYEREVIRENAYGLFANMLLASAKHPAMLVYLDNASSIGANSQLGIRNKQGLNENLAREILELHTLGVNGGYAQKDVVELAKIITGWTIPNSTEIITTPTLPYGYIFAPRRHEVGEKTLLKKTYQAGEQAGVEALKDLAEHPNTAKFIAEKLVRHFISDKPIPSLQKKLEASFINTKGNLKILAEVLLNAPESKSPNLEKIRTPQQWILAIFRGIHAQGETARVQNYVSLLGQAFWRPNSPKGYSDENQVWLNGISIRFDIATVLAKTIKTPEVMGASPLAFAEKLLGNSMSPATRQTIERAESFQQGAVIALLSPEMLRR